MRTLPDATRALPPGTGDRRLTVRRLMLLLGIVLLLLVLLAVALSASVAGRERTSVMMLPDSITRQMVALGDSIYHGRVAGGTCAACHGVAGRGTPGLAPALSDRVWLHGDGSMAFLVESITAGVKRPKQSPLPMLPMGGARLDPRQVRAVAAYVYSLTHPEEVLP